MHFTRFFHKTNEFWLNKMILRYCIRTCPQRKELCEELYGGLKKILPSNVQIDMVNDTIGRSPIKVFAQYLKDTLLSDTSADFDYLVVLEDDAKINTHLHTNIINFRPLTKPQTKDKVGCVQLSLASLLDIVSPYTLYSTEMEAYFRTLRLHYSCGMVFSRNFLKDLDIDKMLETSGTGFDIQITEQCHTKGFMHLLHFPALVATQENVESTLNHTYKPVDDLFSQTWSCLKKDEEFSRWYGVERLYGFHRKAGEPDENPTEKSSFYLQYLEKDVFKNGQIVGQWNKN